MSTLLLAVVPESGTILSPARQTCGRPALSKSITVFDVPSVISATLRRPASRFPWNTPSVSGIGLWITAGAVHSLESIPALAAKSATAAGHFGCPFGGCAGKFAFMRGRPGALGQSMTFMGIWTAVLFSGTEKRTSKL
jgi:hypothetical protein